MKRFIFTLFCIFVINLHETKAQAVNCVTPNGERAKCLLISNCPLLYEAVLTEDPEVIRFLKASKCGYSGGPLVCCGSTASYSQVTTRPVIRRPDLLPNKCGEQFVYKILNGQNTTIGEYPWTALIQYRNSNGFKQFSCGGTLINERYILTAAHCVTGKIIRAVGDLYRVRLGEWNTETERDCINPRVCAPPHIDYEIEEVTPHTGYDENDRDRRNDIALIRLNRRVTYSEFIQPVCLPPESSEPREGDELTVVGWGKTETGIYSPILLKLKVPVVSDRQCARTFSQTNVNVRTTQLCAGGERDKDSCNGDSGGPLLSERDDKHYLEAVVSFGAKCGTEGWPGIYTRVPKFRDWIETHIFP